MYKDYNRPCSVHPSSLEHPKRNHEVERKIFAKMCYKECPGEVCCCCPCLPGRHDDFISLIIKSCFCGLCGKAPTWGQWYEIYNGTGNHHQGNGGNGQGDGGQQQAGGFPMHNVQPQPYQQMNYGPGPYEQLRQQQIAAGNFHPMTQDFANGPRPDGSAGWRERWEQRQAWAHGGNGPEEVAL